MDMFLCYGKKQWELVQTKTMTSSYASGLEGIISKIKGQN